MLPDGSCGVGMLVTATSELSLLTTLNLRLASSATGKRLREQRKSASRIFTGPTQTGTVALPDDFVTEPCTLMQRPLQQRQVAGLIRTCGLVSPDLPSWLMAK